MIDLHCHVNFYDDPKAVLERASEANIYVLSVTNTPEAWYGAHILAEGFPRVRTALGLHPQLAHQCYEELPLFEEILPETQYVSEIGLDKGRFYKEHFDKQEFVFRSILEMLGDSGGKIMSIHSMYAANEVLSVLEQYPKAGPAILHWFTGTKNQLKRAIEMGCWFSVGPKMLQSKKGKELITQMPIDRILLETDGPFTQKNNRQPYEPVDTLPLLEQLANHRNIDQQDMKKTIRSNFTTLTSFNKSGMSYEEG
jgi:TatD DNase family protein